MGFIRPKDNKYRDLTHSLATVMDFNYMTLPNNFRTLTGSTSFDNILNIYVWNPVEVNTSNTLSSNDTAFRVNKVYEERYVPTQGMFNYSDTSTHREYRFKSTLTGTQTFGLNLVGRSGTIYDSITISKTLPPPHPPIDDPLDDIIHGPPDVDFNTEFLLGFKKLFDSIYTASKFASSPSQVTLYVCKNNNSTAYLRSFTKVRSYLYDNALYIVLSKPTDMMDKITTYLCGIDYTFRYNQIPNAGSLSKTFYVFVNGDTQPQYVSGNVRTGIPHSITKIWRPSYYKFDQRIQGLCSKESWRWNGNPLRLLNVNTIYFE